MKLTPALPVTRSRAEAKVEAAGNALPPQYFVNMMPADCNIRLDAETNRFFNDQDFDEAVKNARKPFLRDAKDCRRYNKQEV